MNYYLSRFVVVFTLVRFGLAYAQEINTNRVRLVPVEQTNAVVSWQPNTRLLDLPAKHSEALNDRARTLATDVEVFYLALRDKKWRQTYEWRAKAFRNDCPELTYMAEAIRNENKWGLANYEVLSVEYMNSGPTTGLDVAILICKFTELPGYIDSYSVVFWHKEDGRWKCLSAGPKKLDIFHATRPPMVDWE